MASRAEKAKLVFLNAAEIASEEERLAYIQSQTDDDELRREVESLLRHHGQLGGFLNPAPRLAPTIDQPVIEKLGTYIDRYKLVHEIGQGGMGVVYMAVQKEPVKRKVALKVIKPGMDTREVVARFEAERQALALMDHQCIATVLDAGSTPSGRPYFVMELVDGTPITEYCDECRYTTRQRLELFVQVCQAVQHAHQKGVIHRDIKPSNVLVTNYDHLAVPKVIDFGIAKAVNQQLTDQSLYTNIAQMIGTPLYMSPEQAQRSGQDVDTRTDVYSLGVLLYELLTGTTPFDKARFQESSLDEVKRIIREEEPPRPSTRLSTLDAALETIAEKHHTDPRTLSHQVSGDLDWIVMKALEKDRTRRYESAHELAKDVQRYLADEPVQARPPSLAHHAAKWVRRHRVVVWSAIASALAVMVVVVASILLLLAAYEQEKKERASAVANAARADDNARKAEENAAKAQKNYEAARKAVRQMLTQVADERLALIPEMKDVRHRLLQDAVAFYTELLHLSPRDAQAYFERGRVYDTLTQYSHAHADWLKALELEPDNAEFQHALGFSLICGMNPAFVDQRRGLVHAKRAVELEPQNSEYVYLLAVVYGNLGCMDEAWAELKKLAEIEPAKATTHMRVAELYHRFGDYHSALTNIQKSIELDPLNSWSHFRMGATLLALGEEDKALAALNKAIELNAGLPFMGSVFYYRVRGDLYAHRKEYAAALSDLNKSLELAPFRWWLYKQRAKLYFELKNFGNALADIAKGVELKPEDLINLTWISPSQVAKCPDESFRTDLLKLADKSIELNHQAARAYAARGWILAALGQEEKALADLKTAFAGLPNTDESGRLGLSETCYELSNLCIALSHREEVRPYLKRMTELRPEQPIAWYRCALAQLAGSQTEDYRAICGRMVEQFRDAPSPEHGYWTAWTCSLAVQAVGDYSPVVQQAEQSVKADAASPARVTALGAILYRAGRSEKAIERLTEANKMMEAPESTSQSPPAYTWYFLAMAHYKVGHEEEAKKWLDKATEWTDSVVAEHDAGTATLPRNRRLTLQLLREEAEGMIAEDGG